MATQIRQASLATASTACLRDAVGNHATFSGRRADPIRPLLMKPLSKRNPGRSVVRLFPFDTAWDVDSQVLASNIFATSIFPYAGFLYHLQKSKKAPRLMLFGFYFLLVFVLATIVAGVYAKLHYNSILANVDWLHGSAESFLTITNLLIVLGLRNGIREAQASNEAANSGAADAGVQQEQEARMK